MTKVTLDSVRRTPQDPMLAQNRCHGTSSRHPSAKRNEDFRGLFHYRTVSRERALRLNGGLLSLTCLMPCRSSRPPTSTVTTSYPCSESWGFHITVPGGFYGVCLGRGERCHVSAKLGPGWIFEYKVKWEMLPVIISRALHAQLAQYNQPSRLVEVTRQTAGRAGHRR